jgi:PPE-repeat protein
MEMWFQDGITMDTYALASQQATALPQQTPAPATSDGGTSANAAAAAQSTANTASTLGTDLQGLLNAYLGNAPAGHTVSGQWSAVLGDLGLPTTVQTSLANAAATTGTTSTAGSILPVQAAYYVTMLASMPVRMLMSMANSMNASQALQAGQQTLLNSVSQIVDGKLKMLMGSIGAEMRGFASSISAQMASATRLGGLSIPNGWAKAAPEMAVRAAPVLPQTSVSPVNPSAGLPNSPFTQALMGSLSGRGMGTQAAKTAPVKVETRTPAGG